MLVPDDTDRRRRRKEKRQALAQKSSSLTYCYDCGTVMQTAAEAAPAYDACCKRTFQMFQMF
jgi:nitric-oxide synthase